MIFKKSVWLLTLGSAFLLAVGFGAAIAFLDNPILTVGLGIFVLACVYLARRPHLLIAAMLLSSQIKGAERISRLIPDLGIDLTVLAALALYLSLGIQLVTKFDVTQAALRRHLLPIVLFGLFLVVLFASVNYKFSTVYGLEKVMRFAALSTLPLIAPMLLLRSVRDLKDILVALMLGGLLFAAFAQADADTSGGRFTALGTNTIAIAVFAGVALIVLAWWKIPTSSNLWTRLALLPLIIPLIVVLLGSGSRGPLISIVVTSTLLFLLSSFYIGWTRQVSIILVALLLTALVIWLNRDLLPAEALQRIEALVDPSEVVEANSRSELWRAGLANFARHPIFGMGAGGFQRNNLIVAGRIILWPHNLLLEVALEQGLVGLFILLGLLGSTLYAAFRSLAEAAHHAERIWMALTLLGLFTFLLLDAMVSHDLNDIRQLWLSVGLIWWFYTSTLERQRGNENLNGHRSTDITTRRKLG